MCGSAGRGRPGTVRGPARARAGAARGRGGREAGAACATRSRCGAARRWPTSSTRRSRATRSRGSRSCGWPRSSCGSRPIWRWPPRRVVPELEALVREHPLRERLRALLMLALYRSGRQADALAAYQDARATLRRRARARPGPGAAAAGEGDPAARRLARPVGRGGARSADRHGHVSLHRRRGLDRAARAARQRRYAALLDEHRRPDARGVRGRGRP